MPESEKIEIENINRPSRTECGDRAKYEGMRAALVTVLPVEATGTKTTDARAALLPHLP
jgi:hypothetical protein